MSCVLCYVCFGLLVGVLGDVVCWLAPLFRVSVCTVSLCVVVSLSLCYGRCCLLACVMRSVFS